MTQTNNKIDSIQEDSLKEDTKLTEQYFHLEPEDNEEVKFDGDDDKDEDEDEEIKIDHELQDKAKQIDTNNRDDCNPD